jgi:glycosyltransferase involved in cell wall biosynthesis
MRIAYVTAELPYPLTSGYLRHYHFIRALSRDHAVTLLSLSRRASIPPDAPTALRPMLERLEVFGSGSGSLPRVLRLRHAAVELGRSLARLAASGSIDVVLFSGKDTLPALSAVGELPLVIDVCDAASLRLRGELAVCGRRRRLPVAARLAQLERVERRLATSTPHLVFASERDRTALAAWHGTVVPNGVELRYWTRRAPPASSSTVAFSGVLAYRPNHDAAMRLVTRILPLVRERVPEARLVLAGRDPLPELRAAAQGRPGIALTGTCPDLRPLLEEAAVYCAPLRFAAGIQNKLLEALAMELPVVTTAVAADGLRAAGEMPPLLVAQDDEQIAAAVAGLLADAAGRAAVAVAGRRYVARHFSWKRSAAALEAVLLAAVGSGSASPRDSSAVLAGAR